MTFSNLLLAVLIQNASYIVMKASWQGLIFLTLANAFSSSFVSIVAAFNFYRSNFSWIMRMPMTLRLIRYPLYIFCIKRVATERLQS